MIRIEMLAASFGDCILVEYGKPEDRHRVLIDAGLTGTYAQALRPRLAKLGRAVPLDLLVVTHIDRDHICGILPLLREKPAAIAPKDIWFNGRHHLEDDALGAKDGEALGALLVEKNLPWNVAFGPAAKHAVVVPGAGKLPERTLDGGAVITLLSPYRDDLEALASEWDDTLGHWDEEPAADAAPDPDDDILGKRPPLAGIDVEQVRDLAETGFDEDGARPNGSSIAFLFQSEGKRILFAADAHPTPLLRSLQRLSHERVALDAFKLSHHGSMNNLSPDLLAQVECPRYLVSSNGGTFGHPHPETMARIVTSSPALKTLFFNYASPYTTVWDDESTKTRFAYRAAYPDPGTEGFALEL